MPRAQKLRRETHLRVRRNDSPCWISNRFFSPKKPKRLSGSLKWGAFIQQDGVEAQRSRWNFYEIIKIGFLLYARSVAARLVQMRISRKKMGKEGEMRRE
jgi:hypothetical protein